MKKFLRYALISVITLCCNAAMAATIEKMGSTTTGWGDAGNNIYYVLAPNKTLTLEFTVENTSKGGNWAGWVTIFRDAILGAEGSNEYMFMQPCFWAVTEGNWTDATKNTDDANRGTWFKCNTNNFNWEKSFTDALIGANVKATVRRLGATVMYSVAVQSEAYGGTFDHYFVMNCGDGTQDLYVYLGADQAKLNNITDATSDSEQYPEVKGTLVGEEDNSTAFFSAFSDYYTIEPNGTKTLKFKNYSSAVRNWDSFISYIISDADRGAGGYSEYYGMRLDNWVLVADKNCTAQNYGDVDWNWTTLKDKWNGATVTLTVTRDGASVKTRADIAPADGSDALYEEYAQDCGDGTQNIRLFLTVEGGHLDILPEGGVDAIETLKTVKAAKSVRYNLAGQQVSDSYKGVVIENGRKVVMK